MRPNKNAFTSWGFGQNLVCISSKCSTLGKQIRFDLILFERLLNSEDPYEGRLEPRRSRVNSAGYFTLNDGQRPICNHQTLLKHRKLHIKHY